MKATEDLKNEHVHILAMIKVMETICDRLESNIRVPSEHLDMVLDFIRGFADRCHHAKEEDVLFPALEQAGIPREGGPVGVMLHEHTRGRELVKGLAEGVKTYKGSGEASGIVENARSYADLLRQHIYKEDNVLFMMADERLSAEEQDRLFEEFERIEKERIGEGMHEKYHEMLHSLMEMYGVG